MEKIIIAPIHNKEKDMVKICIRSEFGKNREPIYESIMTFEEFGKCVTGLVYCNIESVNK